MPPAAGQNELVGSDGALTLRSERRAFAARARRAPPPRSTAGCRTPAIKRIVDWPARSGRGGCGAGVKPTGRHLCPYLASPPSAAAPRQETWCVGVREQRLGQLDPEHPSHRRALSTGSIAHALANRSHYRLPSKPHLATRCCRRRRTKRDLQRRAIKGWELSTTKPELSPRRELSKTAKKPRNTRKTTPK